MKRLAVAIISLLPAGCNPRVVLVADGTPVQLAEPVDARVYVTTQDGRRVKSGNKVRLPEGWWALPDEIEPRP